MQSTTLKGQIALVTGGSGGLGQAISLGLADAGAAVAVNYSHSADAANEVVDRIVQAGGRALAIKADIGRADDVDAMFDRIVDAWGTVDILVGNSGVQKDAKFVDMSVDDWDAAMKIDLTGQFLCMQAAAREFIRRGVVDGVSKAAGKIVCISSVHQLIPWAGHVNYATAKGGVEMLMKSVAQELAGQRIRVNGIAPGAIKTPINESVWGDPEKLKALLKLIPYGRMGEADEVARAAVWLASDDSDYVTGTTLFIDGGMSLYASFIDNG